MANAGQGFFGPGKKPRPKPGYNIVLRNGKWIYVKVSAPARSSATRSAPSHSSGGGSSQHSGNSGNQYRAYYAYIRRPANNALVRKAIANDWSMTTFINRVKTEDAANYLRSKVAGRSDYLRLKKQWEEAAPGIRFRFSYAVRAMKATGGNAATDRLAFEDWFKRTRAFKVLYKRAGYRVALPAAKQLGTFLEWKRQFEVMARMYGIVAPGQKISDAEYVKFFSSRVPIGDFAEQRVQPFLAGVEAAHWGTGKHMSEKDKDTVLYGDVSSSTKLGDTYIRSAKLRQLFSQARPEQFGWSLGESDRAEQRSAW